MPWPFLDRHDLLRQADTQASLLWKAKRGIHAQNCIFWKTTWFGSYQHHMNSVPLNWFFLLLHVKSKCKSVWENSFWGGWKVHSENSGGDEEKVCKSESGFRRWAEGWEGWKNQKHCEENRRQGKANDPAKEAPGQKQSWKCYWKQSRDRRRRLKGKRNQANQGKPKYLK